MKDDSGSYAVFTEQGSSASQMTTAAKVMDVISSLPGCSRTSSRRNICLHPGQNGKCTIIVEKSEVRMSRYFDTSSKTQNGSKHGPVWKIQSFLLSETCTVILYQDSYGNGNLRKFCWNTVGKKFLNGNVYSLTEKMDYSCLCMRTTKLAGKKQNIDPMWKALVRDVDLGEPTSFLDVYLGCTQRECQ